MNGAQARSAHDPLEPAAQQVRHDQEPGADPLPHRRRGAGAAERRLVEDAGGLAEPVLHDEAARHGEDRRRQDRPGRHRSPVHHPAAERHAEADGQPGRRHPGRAAAAGNRGEPADHAALPPRQAGRQRQQGEEAGVPQEPEPREGDHLRDQEVPRVEGDRWPARHDRRDPGGPPEGPSGAGHVRPAGEAGLPSGEPARRDRDAAERAPLTHP
ncbi:hypothetical protein SAMN05444392_10793 [Seinonella peptonophila]|uniref:Uncharacterized protein n=1 Tax=Seinonella peptonophila TaxID=112248 RepID=A0A1M4YQR0_9BACL|nr:hypothetical protein SAMN05444392_10793 [Seinonella peptonophila]